MNQNTVLLLAVFAVGCAAGMHLDSRAQAQSFQPPPRVQKWQQFCTERGSPWSASDWAKETNVKMKELGEQGWELVTSDSFEYCFKRPAP